MTDLSDQAATALLLTEAEVRRFEAERPAAGAVMTLSPKARAALGEAWRARRVEEPLSDRAHARIMARAHRATGQFMAAIDGAAILRPGTRHALWYRFLLQAYLIARVWETLRGPGPWLLPAEGGWEAVAERESAHRRFVDHLIPPPVADRPPPLAWLYRLLRHQVLRLLRRRGPWLLSRNPGLVFGLDGHLDAEERPLRRLMVTPLSRGPREYQNLLRSLRDGLSRRQVIKVTLIPGDEGGSREVIEAALEGVEEPVVARGLTPRLRAILLDEGMSCEALFTDALDVIEAARPKVYVTRQDSGRFAIVAEAAGAAGVPRYAVNYNTFPLNDSPIAEKVLHALFHVRMPEALSDTYVMWSPHIAATARQVYGAEAARRMQPMRLPPCPMPSPAPKSLNGGGPRRVLYASNFTEYCYFVPWIMETSNEFLDDILTVVERIGDLPDLDLTVRSKPKGECPPDVLRAFIAESGRLHVTGTERPYEQAVAEADLLISFSSTTIEEAILQRTPVLLWGPVRRYRHLPGRTTPPTANSRAAVYAVEEPEDIRPMVEAILEAHAGLPLSDLEIAEHVWPEETPGVGHVARMIAEGARLS